jgi:hypothetical protein
VTSDDVIENIENKFTNHFRSKQKIVKTETLDDQWHQIIEILRHFGVKIDNNKIILNWSRPDLISSYLLVKMLSSISKKNIIGLYDKTEGSWILMER